MSAVRQQQQGPSKRFRSTRIRIAMEVTADEWKMLQNVDFDVFFERKEERTKTSYLPLKALENIR